MTLPYDWNEAADKARREQEVFLKEGEMRARRFCVLRKDIPAFRYEDSEKTVKSYTGFVIGPYKTYKEAQDYVDKAQSGKYEILPFMWS